MAQSPKPGFLRIYPKTTPSPDDPPDANQFYWSIGVATIAWGRLEGHFVSCLMMIIQIAKDTHIGTKLPMRWEKRKELWRDAFGRIPSLKPLETEAIAFLDELDGLSKDRNLMAHCLWESFKADQPLTMDVLNIKAEKGDVEFRRTSISIEDLTQVTTKTNRLNMRLIPLSRALVALLGPPPSDVRIL